jgi:hypothetical protein
MHFLLLLSSHVCVVYPFSQERQQTCPSEVHLHNFMKGGRRVDVMSMRVKEAQVTLHLALQPRE